MQFTPRINSYSLYLNIILTISSLLRTKKKKTNPQDTKHKQSKCYILISNCVSQPFPHDCMLKSGYGTTNPISL